MIELSPIDEYLAGVDEPQKSELKRLRDIIRRLAPDAVESISYGMPAFKLRGKPLCYFAAFKDHMSFFPTSEPVDTLKSKLEADGFQLSKGTIRFGADKPLPVHVVKELLLLRLDAIYRAA